VLAEREGGRHEVRFATRHNQSVENRLALFAYNGIIPVKQISRTDVEASDTQA
jgi:hypothetical protein